MKKFSSLLVGAAILFFAGCSEERAREIEVDPDKDMHEIIREASNLNEKAAADMVQAYDLAIYQYNKKVDTLAKEISKEKVVDINGPAVKEYMEQQEEIKEEIEQLKKGKAIYAYTLAALKKKASNKTDNIK